MSDAKAPLLANATRDLAAFAAGLQYEDIPPEAVQRIKSCLLDSLGCCLFGATLPWTRKVADMVMAEGARPVASLMGMGAKSSVALAALVNGTAGHAFELDDIHKESILHPGSLATPVALAIAEAQGATRRVSGREVITAMTAGYEVGTRVGNAATMSLFSAASIHRAPRVRLLPQPPRRARLASMRRASSMHWALPARRAPD